MVWRVKIKIHDNVAHYGGQIFEAEKTNKAYKTISGLHFGFHEADILNDEKETIDKLNKNHSDNDILHTFKESPTITAFRQIMDDKIKLAIAKNTDYGNSVDKIWDILADNGQDPYIALYIRLADKFHRFENLVVMRSKQQVKDESVMDTLCDMSNYVDLFRGWKMRRDAKDDRTT